MRFPSSEITYPTWGKGKFSSKVPFCGHMLVPRRVNESWGVFSCCFKVKVQPRCEDFKINTSSRWRLKQLMDRDFFCQIFGDEGNKSVYVTPIWQEKHHWLRNCTSLRGDGCWWLQRVTMVAPTNFFRSLSNLFKHEISVTMINHTILDDKYISNDSPVIKVLLQCVTSSSSLGWGCFKWSKTNKKNLHRVGSMLTGHVETSPSNLNVSRGEWTRETDSNRRESKINSVSLVARESLRFFYPVRNIMIYQFTKKEKWNLTCTQKGKE